MTMTSLSVIMAVIVINLYNRGHKTKRAPAREYADRTERRD